MAAPQRAGTAALIEHFELARTIANMPALIASGSVGQASTTADKPGSIAAVSGPNAPDFAALVSPDCSKCLLRQLVTEGCSSPVSSVRSL